MNARALVQIALALLPLLGGAAGCQEQQALARLPAPHVDPPAAPATPIAPADRARDEERAALSGTLEPHRRSTLAASVTGPVARVFVREGDRVVAGQRLVAVQAESFQLGLRQAEAALEAARVQAEAAEQEYQRQRGLLAERAVSRSQFDAIESRHKAARAGLAAAQVGVEMARKAVRDAVLRAPYSGLVVRRHVSEGDYATAMPPSPLVTVEEVATLDLRVQVPSADRAGLRPGASLRVRFPATGQELRARVSRVIGSIDPHTRTFAVIAEVRNSDGKLRPGLFAEVLPETSSERQRAKGSASR